MCTAAANTSFVFKTKRAEDKNAIGKIDFCDQMCVIMYMNAWICLSSSFSIILTLLNLLDYR